MRAGNLAAILLITTAYGAPYGPATAAPLQQSGEVNNAQKNESSDSQPDDIIVHGYLARQKLPTVTKSSAMVNAARIRQKFEFSERLAGCAVRGRLSARSQLRAVVDGEFNSVAHALAQDRLKRIYATCSESASLLSMTEPDGPPPTVSVNPLTGRIEGGSVTTDPAAFGHSIYDRGAFIIATMRAFAPDLSLTPQQTADPVVLERFNLREAARNRFRLVADLHYFQVAVCMVRAQPELSVRLVFNDETSKAADLQANIISRARACVGNAKRVNLDSTQFRIYIADAVYSWAVATRGAGSLIPYS